MNTTKFLKSLLAFITPFTSTPMIIGSPLIRNISAYGHTPECWDPEPRFPQLVFRDCLEIISRDITHGRDPDLPLKFSRFLSQDPDIRLPAVWRSRAGTARNRCLVTVDYAGDEVGWDRTTLNDIKRAAMAVAMQCVIEEPHLGGVLRLGWHDMLGVMVAGYTAPRTRSRNTTAMIESDQHDGRSEKSLFHTTSTANKIA